MYFVLLRQTIIYCGEVSERFKEPVLKTGDPGRDRGFESHPLRFLKEALEDFVSLGAFLYVYLF